MKSLPTTPRLLRLGPAVVAITLAMCAVADVAGADCLDVRDYGAVADGKHDDTLAIQSAIQSAIGVTIYAGLVYSQRF